MEFFALLDCYILKNKSLQVNLQAPIIAILTSSSPLLHVDKVLKYFLHPVSS